jgi:hypothetical protein
MNLIKNIETKVDRILTIDLNDHIIYVRKLGNYEGDVWYSWSVWDPTEGDVPLFRSRAITKDQILERISLLSNDETLSDDIKRSISQLFGKSI